MLHPPERKEWLATLKVGDEVAYSSKNHFEARIGKISHIAQNGRIYVDGLYEFNPNGTQRGAYERLILYPVTQTHRDEQLRRKLRSYLEEQANWGSYSLEQLQQVIAIRDEKMPRKALHAYRAVLTEQRLWDVVDAAKALLASDDDAARDRLAEALGLLDARTTKAAKTGAVTIAPQRGEGER